MFGWCGAGNNQAKLQLLPLLICIGSVAAVAAAVLLSWKETGNLRYTALHCTALQ